jgi:hypothetical protein
VIEKRIRSAKLPWELRPHSRNADRAVLVAEIAATVVLDSEKRFLSHRYQKKDDEIMPGRLNKVRSRVAEVWERWAISCA